MFEETYLDLAGFSSSISSPLHFLWKFSIKSSMEPCDPSNNIVLSVLSTLGGIANASTFKIYFYAQPIKIV
jgi:hypothetical protein